jgi:membrane protease YdiL (CAAX protease family)
MSAERLRKGWPVVHGGIFLACLALVTLCVPPAWPWFWLLPLAAYACIVLLLAPLRRSFHGPAIGRLDKVAVLSATVLSALTVAVLLAYQTLACPDVTALAASLPVAAFGNLVLAWVCFSVVNALLEELIFRGVLYHAVAEEWGAGVAVGGTAVLFGLGHLDGYPPGLLGAVLAGLYGIALGLLRWWTDGLALPVVCHVCADATIFGILFA